MITPSREADTALNNDFTVVPSSPLREKWALIPMPWARELRSRPRDLVILLTIASFAHRVTRKAFPSVATIAEISGVRRDHVSRSLTALEKGGYLTRRIRSRQSSEYTLAVGYPANGTPTQGYPTQGYPTQGCLPRGSGIPALGDQASPARVAHNYLDNHQTGTIKPTARVDAHGVGEKPTEDGSESDGVGSRHPRQQKLPDPHQLAAHQLLDAAFAVVSEHHDLALSRQAWRNRNKAAALDLVRQGKTSEQVCDMLRAAYSGAGGGFYGGIVMLAKLAEHWPAIARGGNLGGASPAAAAYMARNGRLDSGDDEPMPQYIREAIELHDRDFGAGVHA
ncbi:MAG: helix-turn-helix domain-containing protein [Candidatus Eremiobacteraeota bacterium]|nr:helix-turn-helix domain-containing protein [Candidatus Eremiobacteraeota bacterium]